MLAEIIKNEEKKNMARSRSQRKSRIAKNSRSRGNDENWITYHKTEAIK